MSKPSLDCVSCGQPMPGKFCAHCGEKRVGPDDHTLLRMLGHLFEAFTHADGKVFLTLRTLVTHPGRLTADHLRGKRKPYIPPLQLFLIANLIFFLLHPLIGVSNTLTTNLDTHLHYLWHSPVAEALVVPRLKSRQLTIEAYAAVFNPSAVTHAKILVILIVPVFALATLVLHRRPRRPVATRLIFALHICAFWLLFICASLSLTHLALHLLRGLHVFPSADAVTQASTAFSVAVMSVYFFHAAREVFAPASVWLTVVKAVALAVALEISLQAYRAALFFITFWST
jgi:hypothetical protein